MPNSSKKAQPDASLALADQFIFVEVPAPSNDNIHSELPSLDDGLATVSPDVLFTVGELIYDFDGTDAAAALTVALDGAEAEAAEYAAFSSSVMFVFGDSAGEVC